MSKEIKKSRVPKLRFPKFRDAGEWEEVKLEDVAQLYNNPWKVGDENLPYIALKHIQENEFRITNIGNSDEVASNKNRFTSNHFLFGKLRPYLRKLYRPDFDGICSTDIWVVEPKTGNNKDFLFYFFANQEFIDSSCSGATGTRMPRADWNFIKETKWNIPPLPEQKTIANCLSSIDELIITQNQKIDALKAHKKGLMQQLLTGKKRFSRFDGEWEMKAGYKMTDIGLIPKDWDIKSYGEIFDFLSTISNSRADLCFKGDFGYIHYGDIHTRWENTLNLAKSEIPELQRDKIKKLPAPVKNGDLVMADASEDYEGIAKTVEVKNVGDRTVFSGTHTFLMRDRNGVFVEGMRGYIHKIPAVQQQIHKVATGSKVLGISKNTLKNILIPIPKPEEQKAIAGCLSSINELITAQTQKIDALKAHKKGLMQKLFPSILRGG